MVAAFIVLLVVALGGGGYIAFDIVRGTRKTTGKTIVGAEVCEDAPEPEATEPTAED